MDKILNLGCGISPYGTHRVDICKTKSTTHVFDVEDEIQFPNESFDEIFERNLLEHLRNHGFHLEECYRVLKQGGKIVLITDNASCFRHYFTGTHSGRYEEKNKENPSDRHFALFTRHHLKNLFLDAGFKIEKIEFIDTTYWTRWFDKIIRPFLFFSQFSFPRILVVGRK